VKKISKAHAKLCGQVIGWSTLTWAHSGPIQGPEDPGTFHHSSTPATGRNERADGIRSGGKTYKTRRPSSFLLHTCHPERTRWDGGTRRTRGTGASKILLQFISYHEESILQPDLYFSWKRRGESAPGDLRYCSFQFA
jgi:hypothetical protein